MLRHGKALGQAHDERGRLNPNGIGFFAQLRRGRFGAFALTSQRRRLIPSFRPQSGLAVVREALVRVFNF